MGIFGLLDLLRQSLAGGVTFREAVGEFVGEPRAGVDLLLKSRDEGVVGCLARFQVFDRLIRESGMPAAAVSSLLIGLEMKRVTRMLSGRMVELRSPAFAKATAGKQRSE